VGPADFRQADPGLMFRTEPPAVTSE
jgi:hypothetical protein